MARLRGAAAAELQERDARVRGRGEELGDDRVGVVAQQLVLGPRHVVLGGRADLLEEARALLVVEPAAREAARPREQAAAHVVGEALLEPRADREAEP